MLLQFRKSVCEHDNEDSKIFLTCDGINGNCVIAIYSVKVYNMNMIIRVQRRCFFLTCGRINCTCVIAISSAKVYNMNMIMRIQRCFELVTE